MADGLWQSQESDWERHQVPENCEYPTANCIIPGSALHTPLGPIVPPKPGFGGMFRLQLLLALETLCSLERDEDQPDTDCGEDEAEKKKRPRRRITCPILRHSNRLLDRGETSECEGQSKQA